MRKALSTPRHPLQGIGLGQEGCQSGHPGAGEKKTAGDGAAESTPVTATADGAGPPERHRGALRSPTRVGCRRSQAGAVATGALVHRSRRTTAEAIERLSMPRVASDWISLAEAAEIFAAANVPISRSTLATVGRDRQAPEHPARETHLRSPRPGAADAAATPAERSSRPVATRSLRGMGRVSERTAGTDGPSQDQRATALHPGKDRGRPAGRDAKSSRALRAGGTGRLRQGRRRPAGGRLGVLRAVRDHSGDPHAGGAARLRHQRPGVPRGRGPLAGCPGTPRGAGRAHHPEHAGRRQQTRARSWESSA